ncbi:MAG TPA: S8 family serine peptidase, partial [Methylomirabilota bacterium]
GTPATARRVIAVGNHDTTGPPPVLDQVSGRGPSRDGRIEPEIAAVGSMMAPRSRDANAVFGDAYTWGSGTSRSAPLVAGACALLFQCRGASATWANLKQILEDTAGTTSLAIPHSGFGFGILRAANACAGAIPTTDAWLRDDATDTGIEPFTGAVAWLSPDIEILDADGNPVANPSFHPTNRFNNIVRVTVRNRGSQPARNTEVFLYWADPATNLPYPSAWNSTGFYTGPSNFVAQGNTEVIPVLTPGASRQVQFAWAPPAPGSNLRQDNHFCLLVRVENESDASEIGVGGWSVITARNNIALRNVLVQPVASGMGFLVVGSADHDSLIIRAEDAEIALDIPVAALPWRERRLIDRHGRRAPYGLRILDPVRSVKTVLKGPEAEERADVFGATTLEIYNGIARIRATSERKLLLRSLRLVEGARMPARLHVQARTEAGPRFIHVAQYSGGQLVGGVSLQFGPVAKERLA